MAAAIKELSYQLVAHAPRALRGIPVVAVSLGVCVGIWGCGSATRPENARGKSSSSPGSTTACLPKARSAIGRFLAVPAGGITTDASIGNNAMPQCSFTARVGASGPVGLIANVDTSPSPYFRLERTAVEATQVLGPGRVAPTPQTVMGLGLEAYWFPVQRRLMSTDGARLVTVSVDWRRAKQGRELALAEAVSRPYLKTPRGRAGSLAKGAPSPIG